MPIMVIHHSSPNTQDVIASSQPKINTQRIFSKKLPMLLEKSTSLPKGQNINEANLKRCIPTGMAMIVQQQITPTIPHNTERINPPNTNHNICLMFSCYCSNPLFLLLTSPFPLLAPQPLSFLPPRYLRYRSLEPYKLSALNP